MQTSRSAPVLVTGAAGFIGSVVAGRLVDEGFRVRAGGRRTIPSAALAGRSGLEPVICDLDRDADVRAGTAGVGLVVHAAYGPDASMIPQCRRLLAAMEAAGVCDLVYFSSIAVYGDRTGRIVEHDGAFGTLGSYAAAKVGCEALIRDWVADACGGGGRRALLLRPGVVYGRGSRFWIDKMAERIASGVWGDFGSAAEGIAPLIHVDDVAAAVAAAASALAAGRPAGLEGAVALNLVGPETPTWRDYFAALARSLGAPPLAPIGAFALGLRRASAIPAKAWRRIGLPGFAGAALAPTKGEMALFGRDAIFETQAVEDLFDIRPSIGLVEGLASSVAAISRTRNAAPRAAES